MNVHVIRAANRQSGVPLSLAYLQGILREVRLSQYAAIVVHGDTFVYDMCTDDVSEPDLLIIRSQTTEY